jgi:hypothetical protein
MKKIFGGLLTALLTITMTLTAMFVLVRTTLIVSAIANPVQRGLAMAAELLLGVVLLVGTVWLATHLNVRIFGPTSDRSLPPR